MRIRLLQPVPLRLGATAVLAAAVLAPAAAHASAPAAAASYPAYTIAELGVLPGGTFSAAKGVNNAGVVVGQGDTTGSPGHAVKWVNGSAIDLKALPGGGYSEANAINDAGQVAGMSTRGGGGYGYPAKWSTTGAVTDLGGTLINELGVANAIGPSGQVAGGQRPGGSSGNPEGAIYTAKGRTWLGGGLGEARGMNVRGQIVGGPGYIWHASQTLVELPGLPGGWGHLSTIARAINVRGQVVGAAGIGNEQHPVLWQGGPPIDLGMLPGIPYSNATGINAAGDVVGTADPQCWPCLAPRAWRWRAGKLTPLDDLLLGGAGWSLREATGINDRGQIVGSGLHNGLRRGFLLTPIAHVNVNFAPAAASPWLEGTVAVIVTDGRLTVGNAAGAGNNKISYLDAVSD